MKWSIYKDEKGYVLLPENRITYFFWAIYRNFLVLLSPLIPNFDFQLYAMTKYATKLKYAKEELKKRQGGST